MKKTVTVGRATASFSTAASQQMKVSLLRAPWEPQEEPVVALAPAAPEDKRRGPRHLGPYTRDRKTS